MQRTITLTGRRLFRVLALGFAVAAVAAPAGLADAGYDFDNSPKVIPYLSHGLGLAQQQPTDALDRMIANDAVHEQAPAQPARTTVTVSATDGFDWSDMAIGLVIGLGGALALVAVGGFARKLRPAH